MLFLSHLLPHAVLTPQQLRHMTQSWWCVWFGGVALLQSRKHTDNGKAMRKEELIIGELPKDRARSSSLLNHT
jgi:hypothetical protein